MREREQRSPNQREQKAQRTKVPGDADVHFLLGSTSEWHEFVFDKKSSVRSAETLHKHQLSFDFQLSGGSHQPERHRPPEEQRTAREMAPHNRGGVGGLPVRGCLTYSSTCQRCRHLVRRQLRALWIKKGKLQTSDSIPTKKAVAANIFFDGVQGKAEDSAREEVERVL